MPSVAATSPPRILFSKDGKMLHDGRPLGWRALSRQAGVVVKIVVGQLAKEENSTIQLFDPFPEDFTELFPSLTHLHLWNIDGLERLPVLPDGLKCLDLRGCPGLALLPELPSGLETLVIEQCPALVLDANTDRTGFAHLEELSLKECPAIEETWMDAVLERAPGLRKLDASGCLQLTRILAWPRGLVDIRLEGCTGLEALPDEWPRNLRRIGLRRAARLSELPDFHRKLDFIDLAFTESLLKLPKQRGHPRTLYLYGSGLLIPPASELGETADDNVAERTEAYFQDVSLTGEGKVRRCKLLILGNGEAGKTCLSLALVPGKDPMEARTLGSTHGVQFWNWDFKAKLGGTMEPIDLQLWDFGGQEIYHNTHRLFMSKGAVFVVVWKPGQEDGQPPPTPWGYQDEWRPLQYWLDSIRRACPHRPRIAVVFSHSARSTPELEAAWRKQVHGESREECRHFFIDSEHRAGEIEKLKTWLRDNIGQVVQTQGTAVPTYWEIAQTMVRDWIQRMLTDPPFASLHNQIDRERFREALDEEIVKTIGGDFDQRYTKLREALDSGRFQLTDDRIRRTLSFLTHSGWVYWNERLFQKRVIIGQKWALDGIYTLLDRRENSPIYRKLLAADGRFTLSQLGESCWNAAGYSKTEQELLLSLMERCQLCFKLRSASEAWRQEDIFVSFEHLPRARELRLQWAFDERRKSQHPVKERLLKLPEMHKQQWQSFLMDAGTHYGKDARYAADGFYLENEEGETLLITCHLDRLGLGGEIELQISGANAGERLQAAEKHLQQFVSSGEERVTSDPGQYLGKPSPQEEIFISYTWDPPQTAGESGIPPGYEKPVDAIEKFLKDTPFRLIRDKNDARFGDNLKHFMEYGAKRPYVIVVHSDKYWRSPYCLFELWTVVHELQLSENRSLLSVVIPVEHRNSEITTHEGLEEYLKHWETFTGVPRMLEWTPETLKDYFRSLLRSFSADLHQSLNLNIVWEDDETKALAAILGRLTKPEGTPAQVGGRSPG
jgi:GTPase SAR1 family protein